MTASPFSPGFRFSLADGLILLAGATGGAVLAETSFWLGAMVVCVVLHFFLFCNVFRISRGPELVWGGVFTGLAVGTILVGVPGWPVTFMAAVMLSGGLIWRETRKPWYHGICWQRWNPELPKWWEERDR